MELAGTVHRQNVRVGDIIEIAWSTFKRDPFQWIGISAVFAIAGWGGAAVLQAAFSWILTKATSGIFDVDLGDATLPQAVSQQIGNYLALAIAASLSSLWFGVLGLGYMGAAIRNVLGMPVRVADVFAHLHKTGKYIGQLLARQSINLVLMLVTLGVLAIAVADLFDLSDFQDLTMTKATQRFEELFMPVFARAMGVVALLAIPNLYVSLGLILAPLELAYNDSAGALDSISSAWRIAADHRFQILGVLVICGLFILGGALPCFLGLAIAVPCSALAIAALFLALRNGADVPAANTATTLRLQDQTP